MSSSFAAMALREGMKQLRSVKMLRSLLLSPSCNDMVSVEYSNASTGAHLDWRRGAEGILYLVRASVVSDGESKG